MNLALIQARMASTRLPAKALLPICGRPLIWHVLSRGCKIEGIDKTILATSEHKENDLLAAWALATGCEVVRGGEDDVLGRFIQAVKKWDAENVVRLTGDNPLLDYKLISWLLEQHIQKENDYTCVSGFPCGTAADIFSRKALEASAQSADGAALADHVDMYVLENQSQFKITRFILDNSLAEYRLTIDDDEDYRRITELSVQAGNSDSKLLEMHSPQLIELISERKMESLMCPETANISKENLRTAKLVAEISDQQYIGLNDIY